MILNQFEQLTIVEGSSNLVKKSTENLRSHTNQNYKIICDTFEKVDLYELFDVIFIVHTLEHLENPRLVLQRMKSWLKPGGKIFVVVPNANAASRQIAVMMNLIKHNQAVTAGEHKHGHRRTYALDTLIEEVKNAGLNPIQNGGILFKGLANFQLDRALEEGIIDRSYLDGCYHLGMRYPELCASIFVVCH